MGMIIRIVLCAITSTLFFPALAEAQIAPFDDAYAIRITIRDGGTEYRWGYDRPRRFEYVEQGVQLKGRKAKKNVEAIVKTLQLHEGSDVHELVERLSRRYPRLERLDIRYINKEGRHFTWVWQKEEEIAKR